MVRKRICFVNPTVLLKRPVAALIASLADNYDVGLLIPKKGFGQRDMSLCHSWLPSNADVRAYPTISLPISSEWPIPITPKFFLDVFRMYKNYDIIHMWTYFYPTTLFVTFAKLFFPKKRLVMTCDTFPSCSFDAGKFNWLFKVYHRVFGRLVFLIPNVVTVYAEYLKNHARRISRRADVRVIPTGVNIDRFRGKAEKDIRSEFSIKKNETLILYVGLLVPRKGIDTLIKAVSELGGAKVKVLVVGDGPKRREYENMAKALGLSDKIIFTGFRNDVSDFYKAADIFFFPTRGEGVPGAVMEAMAARLPVVASDIPAISCLIDDAKNGYLCEKDNISSFAKRLLSLIKNDALCKRIGENAFTTIRQYDWSRAIAMYKQLYDSA